MEFNEFSTYTKFGLESSACLLLCVIAFKIYKMKIHSRSGCCGDKLIVETLNRAGSSSDLEFTNMNKDKQTIENAII